MTDLRRRVAQSGLFIAPSATQEHLCSYLYHPWMIEHQGETLIFQAKERAIVNPKVHEFFSNYVMNNNLGLDQFTLDHWNALVIDYQWDEKPRIEVRGEPFKLEVEVSTWPTNTGATHVQHGSERFRARVKLLVRKIIHSIISTHQTVNLADILACPSCHGSVLMTTDSIHSSRCNLDYPMEKDIPIMLVDHAIPSVSK